MARLGHSIPLAAMHCHYAAQGRDKQIAAALPKKRAFNTDSGLLGREEPR
jgi:hypothetical protein